MYANLTDDGRTHRTYSDDDLPWQNRSSTFLGFVIPLTVCFRRSYNASLSCYLINRGKILAWLSVGLRLYSRIFQFRCPGWDDVIIAVALVSELRTLTHETVNSQRRQIAISCQDVRLRRRSLQYVCALVRSMVWASDPKTYSPLTRPCFSKYGPLPTWHALDWPG